MMSKVWIWFLVQVRVLAREERGASLVEYALLIAIAVLVVLVAVRSFSEAFVNATNFISDEINDAVNKT